MLEAEARVAELEERVRALGDAVGESFPKGTHDRPAGGPRRDRQLGTSWGTPVGKVTPSM